MATIKTKNETKAVVAVSTKRGRPTQLNCKEPEYHQTHSKTMLELMAAGKFEVHVMSVLNISKKIFDKWIQTETEFKDAYEIARPKCMAWWLTEGMERWAIKNDKGQKFWFSMMEQFKDLGWQTSEAKGRDSRLSIGNINIVQSRPELLASIKANLSVLPEHVKLELIEARPEMVTLINDTDSEAA